MPLADINGYKALWHFYKGYLLPFRLLYPYNYDPQKSYPLIVNIHGSGELGKDNISQLSWSIAQDYYGGDEPSAAYTTEGWDCFVLCPQYNTDIINYPVIGSIDSRFTYPFAFAETWNIQSTCNLIDSLLLGSYSFYDGSSYIDLQQCNINSDKIIASGSSFGAIAAWQMCAARRDLFSCVVPTNCFLFSTDSNVQAAFDSYDGDGVNYYNNLRTVFGHIPAIMMTNSSDRSGLLNLYLAMKDCFDALTDKSNIYFVNTSSVGITGHTYRTFTSIFNPDNKFNTEDHAEQSYNSSGIQIFDYILSLGKASDIGVNQFPDLDYSLFDFTEFLWTIYDNDYKPHAVTPSYYDIEIGKNYYIKYDPLKSEDNITEMEIDEVRNYSYLNRDVLSVKRNDLQFELSIPLSISNKQKHSFFMQGSPSEVI